MHFKFLRPLALFNPQIWIPFAKSLNSEGSGPSMFLIAVAGTLFFGHGTLGSLPYAKLALLLTTLPWFCIGILAMQMAFRESIHNLGRLRLRAVVRSRFWNEISRVSWNLLVTLGALALVPVVLNIDLSHLIGRPIPIAIFGTFVTYMLASVVAVMIHWRWHRMRRSRAKECIKFFFPICAVGLCYSGILVLAKSHVMPVIAVTVVLSLSTASVLANKKK